MKLILILIGDTNTPIVTLCTINTPSKKLRLPIELSIGPILALWHGVIGIGARSCCFYRSLAVPSKSL